LIEPHQAEEESRQDRNTPAVSNQPLRGQTAARDQTEEESRQYNTGSQHASPRHLSAVADLLTVGTV